MTGEIMVDPNILKLTEDYENQIVFVSTPKRKQRIKVFVPVGSFAHWHIRYENGKPIDGLDGVYLSRKEAMKAVILWERNTKKTEDAKQFELFGDKEPPVLKRKVKRAARTQTNFG